MRKFALRRPSRRVWFAAMLVLGGMLGAPVVRPAGAQEFKVVVNNSNSVSSMPKDAVAKLFLKQERNFPGGGAATPVEPAKGSTTREAFAKAVLGWTVKKLDTYWQQQIFSGRDIPPASESSDDAVVAFVKANPGAIGVVSGSAAAAGVKVVVVR